MSDGDDSYISIFEKNLAHEIMFFRCLIIIGSLSNLFRNAKTCWALILPPWIISRCAVCLQNKSRHLQLPYKFPLLALCNNYSSDLSGDDVRSIGRPVPGRQVQASGNPVSAIQAHRRQDGGKDEEEKETAEGFK